MDSRHQSLEQQTLNNIIKIINQYVSNNMDYLSDLRNKKVRKFIHKICRDIYQYAGIKVDVTGRLAKNNLLSIDVVLFPELNDSATKKIRNGHDFQRLLNNLAECATTTTFKKRINTELNRRIQRSLDVS